MSAGVSAAQRDWETVIGLEVHTQLRTASKLFSPAPVRYGVAPNHAVHPIDLFAVQSRATLSSRCSWG